MFHIMNITFNVSKNSKLKLMLKNKKKILLTFFINFPHAYYLIISTCQCQLWLVKVVGNFLHIRQKVVSLVVAT